MPIPRIETRDAMGDPDVVYLNPDHVLWMSQPTAAQRRPGGTAIRVDDRVKGGSLLMADNPPAARLLQDLGPFVTVTLANASSDYPDGLVHVRAQAIVKVATDDHDKPLAERTLGWVHVQDGSAFKIRDYAGVAAQWQASVAAVGR
ncbi:MULTISPECIES: hypothetical protein [unclassified Burkholderia]|uniref:hypothetical protein n=1 Tax=unclassified Burkholderia TaxID=2613784 RepID=UPI00141F9A0B|nr:MULTISPECIES: hypothetical protein [unclassified Burkholderia]NIE60390.1 hypothetical protein [Burkholderia sp. Ap-955]NIF12816.1 hypothetical protein [Burkholderia sp. Ax-1735]NIG07807.1 hypothetical protein [Burkholderia sp. Tr-849]